ncbi:hypothetical protein SLEP1_g13411 [Rubroshorea leprosula]|uniref:RNase H type-1 domain-containing protein n=1 Tax=Rubroshorea leprosula TaxID=152421 RepID=A0AAV5IQ88_9ROSI|nr:hypothetical protein SLEP1_g13411 [Rubroshorea leprosula]
MQSTLLPNSVCSAIDSLNRWFLWGSDVANKPRLVNWDTICTPQDLGGLGDGQQIKFWQDIWVDDKPLHEEAHSQVLPASMDILVSHAITPTGEWNEVLLEHLLPRNVVERILAIPIPMFAQQPDIAYWSGSQDASSLVADTRLALSTSVMAHTRSPRWVKWLPPDFPFLKSNTDGAMNLSFGSASVGGLICDHGGRWRHGFAINIGQQTSYMAELWGCRTSLQLASALGITHLVLEMDSLLAVQMIQARKTGEVADFMASLGHNLSQGTTFFLNPPEGIGNILHRDNMGTLFLRT